MKLAKILKKLVKDKPTMENRFGVTRIAVFGSWTRGDQGPDSDVDILVEVGTRKGLFEFIDLQQHLEKLLGIRVDLATPDMLHPSMRKQVLAEAVYA